MTDYMKEAERLLSEYGHAVSDAVVFAQDPAGYSMRMEEATRAALLAHIQRGAVPEGWQLVPKEPTPEMLAGGWGYWLNVMVPGKQRDTAAKEYSAMLAAAPAPDQFRDAAKMMAEPAEVEHRTGPASDADMAVYKSIADGYARDTVAAPAEVPMPEPVAYGFGNTAITGHTNRLMMVRLDVPLDDQYAGAFWLPLVLADEAHTYGIACRAAGEAAGYARGLREMRDCRTCRNYTRDGCIQTAQCVDGDGYRRAIPVRFWATALRGEVKP